MAIGRVSYTVRGYLSVDSETGEVVDHEPCAPRVDYHVTEVFPEFADRGWKYWGEEMSMTDGGEKVLQVAREWAENKRVGD